eukprot:GHVL01033502.1.p2 GENE.GHVL01033502.1~~GHVL01033502.1.p2  ORF type:complete len:152 (+),score=19.18 GHVL01033502.1:237-692(+)
MLLSLTLTDLMKLDPKTFFKKVEVIKEDITKLKIDAIVNAANKSLLGGGGVDGAIHRAAGKKLLQFNRKLDGCTTGDAKISPGFDLPAKFIIHAVGPIGEKPDKLSQVYHRCLELAVENKARVIAFPCISTGIFGYPPLNAAKVICIIKKM